MTHIKTTILLIWTAFFTSTTFAESKLARINDPDGFTNIRSGQNANSPVVATFDKDDLFYCDWTSADWLKVTVYKKHEIQGYIHKSKVQLIETLDARAKKQLLTTILSRHKTLADNFQTAWRSKDSLAYRTTVGELELHSDMKYSPILDILPSYFCETKDTIVLQLFFATMWSERGSANEMPSVAIGDCFICQTEIALRQLRAVNNTEQRILIYDQIEFGLVNHFSIDENVKFENKEYNRLKKLLDDERKKTIR